MPAEKNTQPMKAPPRSLEAEEAVLGSMLSSREAVSKALQWLKPNHFYKPAHQKIFASMVDLFNNNEQIDTISISDSLKKQKILESVGGAYFLTGLVESIPTTANVESYSKIVLEKSLLRQLIQVAQELSNEAYDDHRKAEDILDRVEQSIFAITQTGLKGGFQHIEKVLYESFEQIDAIAAKKGTGIKMLVHCSAGVGRTGTFIALYQTMELLDGKLQKDMGAEQFQTIATSTKIDLFNAVFKLRSKRTHMVTI